ncbi:hypothetical protein GCM10010124_04410 [Pilimelia terevasa]|uniref:Spermatogenesis-associated protein 20-like TRX domain-containing protein n=1 Tax=Pilimelia terevasa TaxID=53372 RepID=A0A8J3FE02_9ACTN|nr:thioredoxin domain-containing protein [Pilimelia terevasa]GGK14910.1 hypothetical protein GCM10010124_04410 [Pilimelia terevasa]
MNRLGAATSPYLLQHADNPVAWWPWGAEAFAEARRRDVPVLISIGYAACHWCHVMAHESFEDDGIGALLDGGFVAVKVDREEHPDVDAVYMTATQAMTGQGGWPMTVFATPDGQPFFCGTYLPREQFAQLLTAIGQAWQDQREAVLAQGAALVEAVAGAQAVAGRPQPLTADLLDGAVATLAGQYDRVRGGFGGAPKFPPSMDLPFLIRHHQRTGSAEALEMVRHTAESMARGGLYDQLGGGFARYSVDAAWTVPHFEKMLYDNALLLRAYTQLWRVGGDPLAARVAHETATFLRRDLGTAAGGFASALDADTDGVEGLTYAWTPRQLVEALGEDDGAWAADLFGVTAEGTFEGGTSVLRLARDIDDAHPDLLGRWTRVRDGLLSVRARRPQPARDDKVVAAWNGLVVTALAEYAMLGLPEAADAADAAVAAGRLLAGTHLVDGRLRRVSRDGVVGAPAGVLEDYGCVAEGFAALHQLTADGAWLTRAGTLLDAALTHFAGKDGHYFDTADDADALITRPADPTDNATPSGLSSLCAALVAYAALTGRTRYREAAEAALATVAPAVARHPRATGYSAATGEALLAGPVEIAVALPTPAGRSGAELAAAARRHAPPGAVVVAGPPDAPGVPLLAGRPLVDGAPTAYVCRAFTCAAPVTTPDALAASLAPPAT